MTIQEQLKQKVAAAALVYVENQPIIGIGSGSTIHHFITALAAFKHRIDGCVASSNETAARLKAVGIPVIDLAAAEPLPIYIDGADEVTSQGLMLKGAGGACTREKILATVAREFICIVDESKVVTRLQGAIAVEVIPLARGFVAREMIALGGQPVYRERYVTDNGNIILDGFNFDLTHPHQLETALNQIPGVVENGVFAKRPADKVLVASVDACVEWRIRG